MKRTRRVSNYAPAKLNPTFPSKSCIYRWCNQEDRNGISCNIDLPIVKVLGEHTLHIEESCIILNEDNEIVNVFITEDQDKNICEILKNHKRFYELTKKYQKKKKNMFYSVRFKRKSKGKPIEGTIKPRIKYGGENYLYGTQRFLHPVERKQMIRFFPIKENYSDEFMKLKRDLFVGLADLEKLHIPVVAEHRYNLTKDYPCVFRGLTRDRFSPTCMGSSYNFSNQPHSDSSVKGTMESILFAGRPNYKFKNDKYNIVFHLKKNCVLYQPPTDLHHTIDTGSHGGYGYVLLSKVNLCCKTKYTKELYTKFIVHNQI